MTSAKSPSRKFADWYDWYPILNLRPGTKEGREGRRGQRTTSGHTPLPRSKLVPNEKFFSTKNLTNYLKLRFNLANILKQFDSGSSYFCSFKYKFCSKECNCNTSEKQIKCIFNAPQYKVTSKSYIIHQYCPMTNIRKWHFVQ